MQNIQMPQGRWTKAIFFVLLFLAVIAGGTLLKIMQDFVIPVVLAILLAFVFFPIVRKLNKRWHIPWWLGIALVYILFFGVVFGIANILTVSFRAILGSLPDYEEKFRSISISLSESFSKNKNNPLLGFLNFDADQSFLQNVLNTIDVQGVLKQTALGAGGTIFSFSKSLFLVTILSIFLLAEMNSTERKIVSAFGAKYSDRVHTVMQNVISETTRYISIKFVASVATGIVIGGACQAVGQDFAVVFGFIAFVMNFIPTFGSIIAWVLTSLFALLQFYPSPAPILVVTLVAAAANVIIGQILEPKIEGKDLGLSPFVILVSLSLWGWLWGFLGLLLAVPLTVIVKIVCENVSFLQPVAIFLGHKPQDENDVSDKKLEELETVEEEELEELEKVELDDARR